MCNFNLLFVDVVIQLYSYFRSITSSFAWTEGQHYQLHGLCKRIPDDDIGSYWLKVIFLRNIRYKFTQCVELGMVRHFGKLLRSSFPSIGITWYARIMLTLWIRVMVSRDGRREHFGGPPRWGSHWSAVRELHLSWNTKRWRRLWFVSQMFCNFWLVQRQVCMGQLRIW